VDLLLPPTVRFLFLRVTHDRVVNLAGLSFDNNGRLQPRA
jgi:hypothetical protein